MAGVVDSHVHMFPSWMIEQRERLVHADPWFGALYANPRAVLVDTVGLISAMDEAGVEHAVVCGFPWRDPGLCREHNEAMAAAAQSAEGRLSWLGIVVPGTAEAELETKRCLDLGARGIGELNADAQGFDWRDRDALDAIVDQCQRAKRPLLLHASEPVGHRYPGKGTATPDKLLAFLDAFPDVAVVAAHWGGGLPFYELMPEVAQICANVVYDCGASTYLYRPAVFRTVLDLAGPERVLFGSDFPVLRMDRFLNRVRAVSWRDGAEHDLVLGGNARRVFGIGVDE